MKIEAVPISEKMALTVKEAAALLGVSERIIYDIVHIPGFPAFQPGGGKWLINRRGLQAWLDQQAGEACNEP